MADETQVRLESWKEIAAYIDRDVRTARRWELEEGLPVHRLSHKARATVYAFPSELDAWRASRKVVPEPEPPRPLWKMPAFALTMALCLVMVGNGLRPQVASAQASPGSRQVWTPVKARVDADSSVSRDGRYLVFRADDRVDLRYPNLGVHDLVTGEDVVVTNNRVGTESPGKAVFSPNGRTLAYTWSANGETTIRTLNWKDAPAEQPQVLLKASQAGFEDIHVNDWSRDGNWLAVQIVRKDRTVQIGLVSLSNGSVRVLKSINWAGATSVQFSPDGRFLAYDLTENGDSQKRNVFVLAVDGSKELPAVTHAANDQLVGWSPDGKQLLFLSDRNGSTSLWSQELDAGKLAGSPQMLRTNLGSNLYSLFGVTDAGQVYFALLGGAPRVITAEFDWSLGRAIAGTQEQFPFGIDPAWSADGKQLAYLLYHVGDEGRSLTIRDLKTGSSRRLDPNLQYFQWPRWSPDSRSFIVSGSDTKGREGIFQIDGQSAEVKDIVLAEPDQSVASAQWLKDGKRIVYLRNKQSSNSAIIERDLASGKELVIVSEPGLTGGGLQLGFLASPDERLIAYCRIDPQGNGSILVRPYAGGEAKVLLTFNRRSTPVRIGGWSPDGRSILYSQGGPADFGGEEQAWMISVDGSAKRRLDLGENVVTQLQPQPGGNRVAFWINNQTPEQLWVLENFLPQPAK